MASFYQMPHLGVNQPARRTP